MISIRLYLIAAFSLLLLTPPSLTAQNTGRGFVKAQLGSTLLGSHNSFTGTGGFGVRLNSSLDLFTEAGILLDARDQKISDDLAHLTSLSQDFGASLNLNRTVPARYVIFGPRFTAPIKSVITPFFELGGGAAALTFDDPGFIPSFVVTVTVNDYLSRYRQPRPLVVAGGGIHLAVSTRFGIDIGFRRFHIFAPQSAITNFQAYSALVYRF